MDDKDTTDYVVMSSSARQPNIDEAENTDYVIMNPQFNTDQIKTADSPETKKVSSGSSKSVDTEKAASEDNVNHQSKQIYADDIKLPKNPVDA